MALTSKTIKSNIFGMCTVLRTNEACTINQSRVKTGTGQWIEPSWGGAWCSGKPKKKGKENMWRSIGKGPMDIMNFINSLMDVNFGYFLHVGLLSFTFYSSFILNNDLRTTACLLDVKVDIYKLNEIHDFLVGPFSYASSHIMMVIRTWAIKLVLELRMQELNPHTCAHTSTNESIELMGQSVSHRS